MAVPVTIAKSALRESAAATASPEATEAAIEMLAAGGNAVDAAVAAAWALAVAEPSGSGLGGHTVLLLRRYNGAVTVIEGQSRAPAAASLETITRAQQRCGYRAATVPSTPAALGYAQEKYGVLSRERVFRPAIRLAEEGIVVSPLLRKQIAWTADSMRRWRSASGLLLANGVPNSGAPLRQPTLAETLRRLASYGTDDFYFGEIAAEIVHDMAANGGLITRADLVQAAVPLERSPVWSRYRGHDVVTAPLPSGGERLLQALAFLESHSALDRSLESWYEAIARAVHTAFNDAQAAPAGEQHGETTHLCVADTHGNLVALTQSIQSLFGAKVANEKLGFLYNNYLCTCPRHAHPSQLRGGCQPRSNVAPVFVLRDDAPVLAAGGAGSRRIISAVLQTISHVLDRGVDIREALAAPRIHALASGRVWLEAPAATEALLTRLRQSFRAIGIKPAFSFKMGAVQAIHFAADGTATAAADPRRDGAAQSLAAERRWK